MEIPTTELLHCPDIVPLFHLKLSNELCDGLLFSEGFMISQSDTHLGDGPLARQIEAIIEIAWSMG